MPKGQNTHNNRAVLSLNTYHKPALRVCAIRTMYPGKTNCKPAMRKCALFSFIILFPFLIQAQVRVGLIGGPHSASVIETNSPQQLGYRRKTLLFF